MNPISNQVDYIKAKRVAIDGLLQEMKVSKSLEAFKDCGREMSISFTKLEEAKMWLGKCLEALGTPYPAELADKAPQVGVPQN